MSIPHESVNLLGRLRIQSKLLLMLVLPSVVLLYFSSVGLQGRWTDWNLVNELDTLTGIALEAGGLVHGMQKERGRSALFLAARGESYRTELAAARQETDARLPLLKRKLETFLANQNDSGLNRLGEKVFALLAALPGQRVAVDRLETDLDTTLDHYTTLNLTLIDLIEQGIWRDELPVFIRRLNAYLEFLRGKDLAGLERARTSRQLHLKELEQRDLASLVRIHTDQEEHLRRFVRMSASSEVLFYQREMEADCVAETLRVRKALLGKSGVERFSVSAATWFDLSSCRIDHMRTVEEHLVNQLRALLEEHRERASLGLTLFLLGNAVAIFGTLLLVVLVVRQITRQTRGLVEAMQNFAEGRLEERSPVTTADELGQIARAFNEMAALIETEAKAAEARTQKEREDAANLRRRTRSLQEAVARVGGGDLTVRAEVIGDDDLAQLGAHFNHMIESLAAMARQSEETSRALATTLEEVQNVAQAQSSGASQQAAALNETTTTLAQIKSTSAQTLEKAQNLGRMAERTRREGEEGRQAVESTVSAMAGIRDKVETIARTILNLSGLTQRIGEITTSVTNLAQQSKMLALNASIEAAKAGEAGKGFAVVAEEVKSLAEQSQGATTQVHRILEEIRHATDKAVMATEDGSKEVDEGARLMTQTGQVIQSLSEVIREGAVASQQIVAAVRQEVAGIDQINAAMGEINSLTNQFVTSARQTAQATRDLGLASERLRESIRVYRV